jgi:DNA primase catalytic core
MFSNELNDLIAKLKQYTYPYAMENGVKINGNGFVSCLFPDHRDSNPSMSYWEDAGVFHCFGCGRIADIFTLANIYEGKPLAGRDFLEQNVFYLAEKYNEPYMHLMKEITAEDLERMSRFRVIQCLSDYVISHVNKDFLQNRSISEQTAKKLLIGSVSSFENCYDYLIKCGCEVQYIEEAGITKFKINEKMLVMIIKDEFGRPVSFVSRNMFFKPGDTFPKYINGSATPIFNKSRTFFGWSDIKKDFNSFESLVIVEGYIDFITAYQKGYRNVVALGSASFTDDHISIIEKDKKIKSVAIALDHDITGQNRTYTLFERIKGRDTVKKYLFAVYRSEGKDLDEIINASETIIPLAEIFDFKTMFDYEIMKIKENAQGADESLIFDNFTAIISKTERPKDREEQANTLASYLNNYSRQTILSEVDYIMNNEKINVAKVIGGILDEAKLQIKDKPELSVLHIENALEEVKEIDKKKFKNTKSIFEKAKENFMSFEEDKKDKQRFSVKFGLPALDDMSLAPGDIFVMPAKSHIGKSTIYQAIMKNAIQMNDNVVVFYVTTDDPAEMVYSNLIASLTGLSRDYCKNPLYHHIYGFHTSTSPYSKGMFEAYQNGTAMVEKFIEDKKLVILDVKDGVDEWSSFEKAIKEISQSEDSSDKFRILIVDSVNKITASGITDPNMLAGFLSNNLKKLGEKHKFLVFENFELNKCKINQKATTGMLSGSRSIYYDSTALALVHNPFHEFEGNTDLFWVYDISGNQFSMPVLVTEMEKSKAGGEKYKPYFYKLNVFNNIVVAVDPSTEEHSRFLQIWREEQNKYIKF